MVFGFGKKKNIENTSSSPQQEKEILLQDVASFIKELETPRLLKIIQQSKHIKNDIEKNCKNISDIILQFEKDDLKLDDVDKNLKTVVKRGKDAVLSTIKKEVGNKLSSIEKYDDILTLNVEISQSLKRIGDILGVHTRVMHVFARKYAEKLKEELTVLTQNKNMLQNLINEQENFKMNSGNVLELIRKIDSLRVENKQKNKRLDEVTAEIDDTKKNATTLEHDIQELRSTQEYHNFLEIKQKIDLLSHEKASIKNKIDAQFSKISRPLSKYSYISSFEKPMKKLMEDLISDPYQVISIQNKNAITEILEATTKSVLAGNTSVKDSDKAVQQIEETISRLDEFLMLKDAYTSKITDLESNLGIFDAELLETKEKALQKAKSNIVDLEISKKKLEKEIEENNNQVNSTKSETESSLSRLSNTKMAIKSQDGASF